MNVKEFEKFVNDIKTTIEKMIVETPERFALNVSSDECEQIVVDASERVLLDVGIDCPVNYYKGGHAFPDIVFNFHDGTTYGIEVKSTKSADNSWVINGNSVLGTTRVPVIDLHIVFIKINKFGVFVNTGRYEDCVADVVVTHSPRYRINLNLKPGESFFAKSGISYKQIKDTSDPIRLVTNYFRSKGETAWWLAESVPPTLRSLKELSENDKGTIYGKAFLLFPELLNYKDKDKYARAAKWLARTYSVVDWHLRDNFSASGRVDLNIGEKSFQCLPHMIKTFHDNFENVQAGFELITDIEIEEFWPGYDLNIDSISERKEYWRHRVSELLCGCQENDRSLLFINELMQFHSK